MIVNRLTTRCALAAVCFGAIIAAVLGCGGGGGSSPTGNGGGNTNGTATGPGLNDPPDTNRAACTANAHTNGRARWTVLVYINAANNLQPDSLLNVAQMASVGSDSNVNIVIQWKQSNCTDCGPALSFVGTRRYYVRQHSAADVTAISNGNTTSLDPDRLPDPSTNDPTTHQSDMGSYLTLQNFVRYGSQTYPADHLAVVVWDHGSGWLNVYRSVPLNKLPPRHRAVSQDNETRNEIETWELPTAFSGTAQPIDALIFDCSLEMMAEVAYEIRTSARVFVGSEESPPGAGYPYDAWLTALKTSGTDPCNVGNSIMTTFLTAYPTATDITQSVVDLSKMPSVATALDSFGATLLAHSSDQATVIANARNNAQNYAYPENKDLYHFADLIRTTTTAADLQTAAFNMEAALRGTGKAIIYSGHGATSQANSYGMAIYVPEPGAFVTTYSNLALTRSAPHWASFLQAQRQ